MPITEKRCLNCGVKDDLTEHHLVGMGSKKKYKFEPDKIILCRTCHDGIEQVKDILKKGKRLFKTREKGYKEGYHKGFEDCRIQLTGYSKNDVKKNTNLAGDVPK